MISENIIKIPRTARYYTLGSINEKTRKLWFVFHGYGQLANNFIKEFEVLNNKDTLIIAPEALNKFYLRGFTGKIGATWMTKEDRQNEIADYVNMIDSIYHSVSTSLNSRPNQINVFGFSQGAHTAARWMDKIKPRIDNLILWGGTFPHDCEYENNIKYWESIKSRIVLGTKDKFITEEHISSELEYFNNRKMNAEVLKYEGGHEIVSSYLKQLDTTL